MPAAFLPRLGWAVLLAAFAACNRPSPDSEDPEEADVARPTATAVIPVAATPAEQLSNETVAHTELMRIARNFGKEEFQIALDAWVAHDQPDELAEVRLWWARTDKALERSPFGPKSKKHFDIDYARLRPDHWRVDLVSDRKVFRFDVELDDAGRPAAYTTVVLPGGRRIDHCRAKSGELQARRFLGVPTGIKRLAVVCIDPEGVEQEGRIAWSPPRE